MDTTKPTKETKKEKIPKKKKSNYKCNFDFDAFEVLCKMKII
jgi:hypothetical protein